MTEERQNGTDVTVAKNRIEAHYRSYLSGLIEGYDRSYGRVNDAFPSSREEWLSWSIHLRQRLRQEVMKFPSGDIPLKGQVLDRLDYDAFYIEKVVYQAEEGQFITANLYLPKEVEFPVPAVAVGTGHGGSKSTDYNQYGGQVYAQAGCVVLIPDNIGEGDRRFGGGHWSLTDIAALSGRPIQGKMIWDLIRGIDYLYTRPEVDRERIASMGHSLGGFVSSYAAALDERVKLVIPASSAAVSHLGEQYLTNCCFKPFRVNCYADRPEIVGLIAPRACLINAGTRDVVRFDRVQETYRLARRVYALFECEDKLGFNIAHDEGHAPLHLNKASLVFFEKHLGFPKMDAQDVANLGERSNPDFRVHQVVDLPIKYEVTQLGESGIQWKSTICLALDCLRGDEYRDPRFSSQGWREYITRGLPPEFEVPDSLDRWTEWQKRGREKVHKLLGIPRYPPINANPVRMRARVLEKTSVEECFTQEVIRLGDLELLGRLWMPSGADRIPIVIYLHKSRTSEGAFTPQLRDWLNQKEAVLSLDMVSSSMGLDTDLSCGISATTVNVRQLRSALEYLRTRPEINLGQICCVGEVDDVALFGAIIDERIKAVVLKSKGGQEIQEAFTEGDWIKRGGARYEGIVPELLTTFSRAELLSLCAPRTLVIQTEERWEDLEKVRRVYALLDADEQLQIKNTASQP